MGKAFTEEEKIIIKEKIKTECYHLFLEKGIKKTNIEDITIRVGIAKGGFYSFYKNKEEVLYDLIDDDMEQQIMNALSHLDESHKNPKETLYEIIRHHCKHMRDRKAIWMKEPDIMEILSRKSIKDNLYTAERNREVLQKYREFWLQQGSIKSMDLEKLLCLFYMSEVIYINREYVNSEEFDIVFEQIIKQMIDKYIKL
ncbi:TetR/AcrR family transcriptional regulator [Anaerocolumna sp. MB42-C2]|uniref:TetR/AcrR family transcriptional regulator n=1 Tax=Anaerocolumna sp. MB42-C2 TaxID=3070997 RepID=UPI0027E0D2A1|nr:TetR/AcrR family transcriptional regulator [Anaerocolumna sp. MB42-C2]WMJ86936.1 TetR/AcrR family transcriptional regulator [Anaerocolumna sp. MB42-C2]